MILYSVVPAEIVFQHAEGTEETAYLEADFRGERVIVAKTGDRYILEKLLSTCPRSFLDSAFQPGNTVEESELHMLKK